MKKLLSLVLVGIMVLLSVCVLAENNSTDGEKFTHKSELTQLYEIGIMSDVGSGPYQNITRSEMAKIVTQTLKMTNVMMPNTFTDVPDNNPYINQIGVVKSMKIMCGYGNDIFNPDADITYYEVVKTIVTMLGYEPLAMQRGGYPHGYLKVGNQIGIILYPGAEDYVINKNEIAKILIKAVDVPLMQQTSFGKTMEYQISEETIKSKYLATK